MPTIRERLGAIVAGLVGLFYLALILAFVGIPLRGPAECRRHIREATHLALSEDRHAFRTAIGTRRYEDHWIVVVEALPRGLSDQRPPWLLVCHYAIGDFSKPLELEVLDGQQLGHVRDVSRSVYSSWWPAEN